MIENATDVARAEGPADVASRIAAATAARRRRPDYPTEVRALLDAARSVIAATGKARVADIVAAAGLSNDAFYRHFPSKDALVAALSEDGTERLAAALARRMDDHADPESKVRSWVEGLLDQATTTKAEANVAVLNVGSGFSTAIPTGAHERTRLPLARLLVAPFDALGSPDAALDAELVTHAVTGRLAGHLWAGTTPSPSEVDDLTDFSLRTARHR